MITGEIPLIELNELKRQGVNLKPFRTNAITTAMYGQESLAAYEALRLEKKALSLRELAKRFPTMINQVDIPVPVSVGKSGVFSPSSSHGMGYARAFASGDVLLDSKQGVKSVLDYTRKAPTPLLDKAMDVRNVMASVTDQPLKTSPKTKVMDLVMGETPKSLDPKAPKYNYEGFNFEADKPVKPKSPPKVTKLKNIPKNLTGKRLLGAIPILGGAVDGGMGIADLLRAGSALIDGDTDAAWGHTTNAMGHGLDLMIAATVVGEGLNIGANTQGYDGFGSFVESMIFD